MQVWVQREGSVDPIKFVCRQQREHIFFSSEINFSFRGNSVASRDNAPNSPSDIWSKDILKTTQQQQMETEEKWLNDGVESKERIQKYKYVASGH